MATQTFEEFSGNKDLARIMGMSVKSVKRWSKKLNVPPTVPANSCQRWSAADTKKLIQRWRAYWQRHHKKVKPAKPTQ